MNGVDTIPEDCREGYARLCAVLVKYFSVDKISGKAEVHFKEGVPMTVEPSPRIRLDK